MPKYRKLHTCTLDSLALAAMPDDFARLTWLMFPLILSREGTTLDHPHYIRSKLYPLRDDVTLKMVQDAVQWFKDKGMVETYQVDGRDYLWFPTFPKYQGNTEREASSTFPAPPYELVMQYYPDGLMNNSGESQDECENGSCSQVDANAKANTDADADANTRTASGTVHKAWQNARGGAVNQMDAEQLNDMVDEFTPKWVEAAIAEANAARSDRLPSLNFVRSILERWKREGFKAPFDPKAKRAELQTQADEQEAKEKLKRDLEIWQQRQQAEAT